MRKSLFAVAALVALAAGIATAAPSQAEHLPAEQQSPCRPNAPAGEQVVGYADADVQRDLPTIYFNATDPQRAYIGACGGGSAGEPIRYVEMRMTPGGPYVYGSDAAGGRSFGHCVEEDQQIPNGWALDRHCVGAEVPGDGRGVSGEASTSPAVPYFANPDESEYYSSSRKRFEVAATQDGVTLTHYSDHYYYDPYWDESLPGRTDAETFALSRNETGTVTLTRTTSEGCGLAAEDDLRDADPPVYTESGPGGCVTPVRTAEALVPLVVPFVEAVADYVASELPPAPNGPPSAAACRPSPEAGEQTVPLGNDSPAIVYVNTTAAQPYAGVCAGGANGEPVRFVEVRETAGGPFLYQSDGSGGHVVEDRCVLVLDNFWDNSTRVCVAAAVTESRTEASVWQENEYDDGYDYATTKSGVTASQDGVERFSRTESCSFYCEEHETQFLRRSPDGRVEAGQGYGYSGYSCDQGVVIDLANPASSGPFTEGDLC